MFFFGLRQEIMLSRHEINTQTDTKLPHIMIKFLVLGSLAVLVQGKLTRSTTHSHYHKGESLEAVKRYESASDDLKIQVQEEEATFSRFEISPTENGISEPPLFQDFLKSNPEPFNGTEPAYWKEIRKAKLAENRILNTDGVGRELTWHLIVSTSRVSRDFNFAGETVATAGCNLDSQNYAIDTANYERPWNVYQHAAWQLRNYCPVAMCNDIYSASHNLQIRANGRYSAPGSRDAFSSAISETMRTLTARRFVWVNAVCRGVFNTRYNVWASQVQEAPRIITVALMYRDSFAFHSDMVFEVLDENRQSRPGCGFSTELLVTLAGALNGVFGAVASVSRSIFCSLQ